MKAETTIEWPEGERLNQLIWKFSSKGIKWGTLLVLHENEGAALFRKIGFIWRSARMYDFFVTGQHTLEPSTVPVMIDACPEIQDKDSFACSAVFCSMSEFSHSFGRVTAHDSYAQAWFEVTAQADCKFRIFDAALFLRKVVASRKKFSTEEILVMMNHDLGKELGRVHWHKDWLPLKDKWKDLGLEVLYLQYSDHKEKGGGASV